MAVPLPDDPWPDDPDPRGREAWAQEEPFDEFCTPEDAEGVPVDLPTELREDYLAGPWTGDGEAFAAGFLHHADGPSGAGFASGGALDRLAPGPMLAGFISRAAAGPEGLAGLGESELIGVLCAARRMASWAAAQENQAVITLARRRAAQAEERRDDHLIEHLSDEIAAALTLTGQAASRLLDIAAVLDRLPAVRAALAAGIIDWPRAVVFADELACLPDADARLAAAEVLDRAGMMTTGQLRAALRRAVLAIDPDAARRRRKAARRDASVQIWSEPSGNCVLAGRELRPADAIGGDAWLTAQAKWLQARGAAGTMDQLRADVLAAVVNGREIATLLPAMAGTARPGGPPLTGTINLTLPVTSWVGVNDRPGEIAGFGAADADTCRDLAAGLAADPGTRWCLTLTDPDGRAVAHACARRGPGGRASVLGRARLPMLAEWLARLRPQRLESGECSHAREVPGYRLPASLRHLIEMRQPRCSARGCRRPARRCDVDHTIPYEQGGRTCECNCAPLCRRHHRAKQAPRWRLDQPEPGVMVWTLPSGRTYTTRPGTYPI